MVCTCTHDSDCQEERRLIEMMKGYCVDGMILNCVNRGDEFKDWLDKLDMKYVILGYQLLPGSHTVGGVAEAQIPVEVAAQVLCRGIADAVG